MKLTSNKIDLKCSTEYQNIKRQLHDHLIDEIEIDKLNLSTASKQQINTFVSSKIIEYLAKIEYVVNLNDLHNLTADIIDEISGWGPIEALIHNEEINDILVNGPENIFVEKNGVLELTNLRFIDENHILRVVRRILAPLGRRVDESSPLVDARLPNGSRINIIIPPLALNGSCVSIRKFRKKPFTSKDLIATQTLNQEMIDFLLYAIQHKVNILVSGGTGAGKTTLLNFLSRSIPVNQRIVTIEDAAELQLNHDHVVRLETRPSNLEGNGEVTARDLVKNALRMRPDRIILGEIRSNEVIDVLQAMNTGHEGSMSTIHANNPRDAMLRMEMLAGLANFKGSEVTLRKMIASAVEVIIQVSRLPNGERKITSIVEIVGVRDNDFVINNIYQYEPETRLFTTQSKSLLNPKLKSFFQKL